MTYEKLDKKHTDVINALKRKNFSQFLDSLWLYDSDYIKMIQKCDTLPERQALKCEGNLDNIAGKHSNEIENILTKMCKCDI